MWHSACLPVLTLFLCCSWFLSVGLSMIKNHETITTNVQLNVIQQSVSTQSNRSAERTGRKSAIREEKIFGSKKMQVPKYMMDLYKKYKEDNYSGRQSSVVDIVRSITPLTTASLTPRDQNYHDTSRRHLLLFQVPASKKGESLETAELKLSTTTLLDDQHVYAFDANDVQLSASPQTYADDTDAWSTYNVTQLLSDRIADQPSTTTLKFIVHTSDPQPPDNLYPQSMLILSYSTPDRATSGRRKRSAEAEDYEEETNNLWDDDMLTAPRATASNPVARRARRLRNTCRRRPLYVDFSEIHYDSWIVAPNGYEAFQCLGKCFFPVSEHLSPTKHAIVQTLIHSVSPGKVSRACCVPTRLEPISVLYVDQRGVLTYRFSYQDMVVAECGCS